MGSCPVCGSVDLEDTGNYRGKHPIFAGMKRVHCLKCGMVFAVPMPTETDLDKYNADYFTSAHGGQPLNSLAKAFHSGIARLRLAHIEHYMSRLNMAVSSALEIGPGSGYNTPRNLDRATWCMVGCHNGGKGGNYGRQHTQES